MSQFAELRIFKMFMPSDSENDGEYNSVGFVLISKILVTQDNVFFVE